MTDLLDKLPEVRGSYRSGAELSKVTWFQVGGPAEVVFRPADVEDLSQFLQKKPDDIPVIALGVGSNLLVRDGGIDGVVVRLGRGFTDITFDGLNVNAGAGTLSLHVANSCADHGVDGLSFLCGIPGTVGGALAMNAGAYGNDVASVLVGAEAVDLSGNILNLSLDDLGYVYRGNSLKEPVIFTKGVFKGQKGKVEKIKADIKNISTQREETQPIKNNTSGSTFKNPEGHKAWELIDKAGCRGLKKGGAQVSEKHCNFFINTGGATASDIEELGEEVRRRVLEDSGVELKWEVQRIGRHKDNNLAMR